MFAGLPNGSLVRSQSLTFFDEVLVEKAAQDGGRDVAVGQQDAGQHGQLVALGLGEPLKEQQQLQTQKVGLVSRATGKQTITSVHLLDLFHPSAHLAGVASEP